MAKSIFDPAFKYRPSCDTSVADTFKRIKKELDAEKKRAEEATLAAEEQAKQLAEETDRILAKTRIGKRGI